LPGAGRITLRVAPSPLRGGGFIGFTQPQAGPVSLELVDLQGRKLQTLLGETNLEAGPHQLPVDRGGLAPGVYYVVLHTAGGRATTRIVVLR